MSGMPVELRALMERYCRLGCLLPLSDDMQELRARAAETRLILKEMAATKRQIDDFLLTARQARSRDAETS
jgi:hypothetical protein